MLNESSKKVAQLIRLLRTFYSYLATLLEALFVDVLFKRKTWRKYVEFLAMYSHGAMRSQVTLSA